MSKVEWYIEAENVPHSIFFPPRRLSSLNKGEAPRAPVNMCPATQSFRRQFYAIESPWDLSLGVRLTQTGAELAMNPQASSLDMARTREFISLLPRKDWRDPSRPIIQVFVPYVFVPQDDLRVYQYPPFQHWFDDRRPGMTISGEFRATAWPRPLAFAFEWFDTSRPLRIRRGEALFYVSFSLADDIDVRLVEGTKTESIAGQQARIGGVAGHVRNTSGLIDEEAEKRMQKGE